MTSYSRTGVKEEKTKSRMERVVKLVVIIVVLCIQMSYAETDISTASNLRGSSKEARILKLQDGTTTIATIIELASVRITKVEPHYGPVSGGTKISISGQCMTCPRDLRISVCLVFEQIQLTANNCSIETEAVVCFTPPKGKLETSDFKVQVSCEGVNSSATLWRTANDSIVFTYKADPIITDVFPKESILAGGITQTVVGSNLDSVSQPLMWTGFDESSTGQAQRCLVWNATLLLCRTQSIPVESSFNDSVRIHPDEIQFKEGTVRIGFLLDGVTAFQRFTTLRMFNNPEVEKFHPEVKVHVVNANKVLSIGVTWPHMTFNPDDLNVRIGARTCTGAQLEGNTITCHPPPLPKSVIRYGPMELNTLHVTVGVGDMTRDVGRLHYTSTESFHVIMIVMIVILGLIFLVSCCCGCCVFFGLRINGCRHGSEKSKFRPISDSSEPPLDGREAGKKRGKRSGTEALGRDDPIECVAMQYRGAGKELA